MQAEPSSSSIALCICILLQVDYILGSNPRGTSYLVGFGSSYPPQVHHRGSSIVSIKQNSKLVSCSNGFTQFYYSSSPNPNVHNGALVGGPDQNDNFQDSRSNYEMTEPATCNTAPMVGVFARLAAGGGASTSSASYTSEGTILLLQLHPNWKEMHPNCAMHCRLLQGCFFIVILSF